MREGLYKVVMHTALGTRRGVLYVYAGKMMGGNSPSPSSGRTARPTVVN